MQNKETPLSVFWFRRDLRLEDNAGLSEALSSGMPVLPIFIFDENITGDLPKNDARISFIYKHLTEINKKLNDTGSSLLILKGEPGALLAELTDNHYIRKFYFNRDYEPYALSRDNKAEAILKRKGIDVHSFKDQVIFEPGDILKNNGEPYTVYTPYKNKWLNTFKGKTGLECHPINYEMFYHHIFPLPPIEELGFVKSAIKVRDYDLSVIGEYHKTRDIPYLDATSHLSPHLRFGTISPRQVISQPGMENETFLSELVWREFFMQILFHFPKVVNHNFRSKYDGIKWRNKVDEFEKWCRGQTGYPIVDAGMRQLQQTGFMHNRVRMITAGFLCKHLLIDWRWGEAWFAEKLLDYELSSNNGNWQWAAGTGCDAAPYFRVFNPYEQQRKFDPAFKYVEQWVEEFGTSDYREPIVEHSHARIRAINTYKTGIKQ